MGKFDNEISRMKAMMSYGSKTENSNQYSSVEYKREGADGKMYGIVREGTKYYIKVAPKSNNLVKESFDYIGGFRNRKDNEYSSYANALKNFDMKMQSLQEAKGKHNIIIESWNPDKKEMLTVEATEKMRKEIARQRQIMANANMIQEKKNYTVQLNESECCKVDKECAATQKNNIKKVSDGKGEPTGNGGDPFTEKPKTETAEKGDNKKEFKAVMESEQVLGWNENEDYLDTSHGTEIGDSAPFTEGENSEGEVENGTVSESVAMHQEDNQNSPAVGTNEIGDDAPFTETVKEGVEDFESEDEETLIDDEDGDDTFEDDYEVEDDFTTEEPFEAKDDEESFEDEEDDIESRLASLEALLNKIAEKVGVDMFEDDNLYDDSEADAEEDGESFEDEEPMEELVVDGEEVADEEVPAEEDEYEVYETVSYHKAMVKEDNMDYFGKHPAYQKEPMEVPTAKHQEKEGYEDINDESVKSEEPFGKEIGDSAPFEINPKTISNAIAESIRRIMKKKI